MVKPNRQAAKRVETRGRLGLYGQRGTGEHAPIVGVRVTPPVLAEVDAAADRFGIKRSEMFRRLVKVGLENLRKDDPAA